MRRAEFRDDDAAREYVERILWPSGPVCPRCGESETFYKLVSKPETARRLGTGVYKCAGCRSRFSVTSDTIFARSHIALHKWLLAGHLISSAKDGISALQLQHELELGSYRGAWFMSRRIHWAVDRIPKRWQSEDAIVGLLQVKPSPDMPRPGTRRQKSVWAQVDEELHGGPGKGRNLKKRSRLLPPN